MVDRRGRILGMIGKTDLFRRQAATASHMVAEIVAPTRPRAWPRFMERLPELPSHLVSAGAKPAAITRRITPTLTDGPPTRRLLVLAEERLGPSAGALALAPRLRAARGRREADRGVGPGTNCMILGRIAGRTRPMTPISGKTGRISSTETVLNEIRASSY